MVPCPSRSEEITLKDGQKIVGTIIGYENDMFRVETTFGIALIRKDKVASIEMNKPGAPIPSAPVPPATKTLEAKPASAAPGKEAEPLPIIPHVNVIRTDQAAGAIARSRKSRARSRAHFKMGSGPSARTRTNTDRFHSASTSAGQSPHRCAHARAP